MSQAAQTVSTRRRTHYQLTFAVLAVAVSSYALLQSLIVPVMGTLETELHTTQSTVTWVLTAYLLSASIFTPIMGRIGDAVGKERMLVVALVALTLGSVVSALAPNIGIMIIGRVIQGMGGGVLPLSFGIIRDEFPNHKVAGAVSVVSSILGAASGLGIVLAGPIVNALDYHWLFWIPAIVTGASAIAAAVFVPESPVRTPGRISVSPAVLLSAWLVALLLGLSEGSDWGWGSARVIGLFVAAVVLIVAWVVVEQKVAVPLIDMTMMRLPAVWTTNLVALLVGVGMYATFGFLPQLAETPSSAGYGFGASITQAGLLMLPQAVAMFLLGLVAARIAIAWGAKNAVVSGSVVTAVGLGMLAYLHDEKWQIYVASTFIGIGIGLVFSCLSALIVAAVPPEQTGVASGMNANIRTIGGSIGSAVMATIVTFHTKPGALPHESGYTHGFAVLAAAMVVCAIAALAIPRISGPRLEEQLEAEPAAEHLVPANA